MVDFEKLRSKASKPEAVDPVEIFRSLPKPAGINDLYTSQADVLRAWFDRRAQRDVVVKLHTGGGKTLVGLLIAQSTLNETREPVLYLAPTVQLVKQAIEKAKACGIPAVPYVTGRSPLDDRFVNGRAIMIGTYTALFNGVSKFGLRGAGSPQQVRAIILDDAHTAFSEIRKSFTLAVNSADDRNRYESLAGLFRKAFKDTDRLGAFDDVLSGADSAVLEVPYWAWHEQRDAVQQQLAAQPDKYVWPLLRDRLRLCHALISRTAFAVTPILPLLDSFPTFSDAPRRIYMSATIADDSEIVRTFDADQVLVQNPLTSRSLAGVSERMILVLGLMPFKFDVRAAVAKLLAWTSKKDLGAIVLVPSDKAAEEWKGIATVAKGSEEVEALIEQLQKRATSGPVVFANRYDGIDLPGDSCRLLVMHGLPKGTGDYEMFRATALSGGSTIKRMLAQRIEQGIGRAARGSGDSCVVVLTGADLAAWIATDANFRFLTGPTRAQLEIGVEVSGQVANLKELAQTVERSFIRDQAWTKYHAERLAALVGDDPPNPSGLDQAATERKAFELWSDGYHEKAISRIEGFVSPTLDPQTRGWMLQLAARIADEWGNRDRAEDLQRNAFGCNRNLLRPKTRPPYCPLAVTGTQEQAIARQIGGYRLRRGFLQSFEVLAASLHPNASVNQFEQALADLATMIGFCGERRDSHGEGPDVLWLLPGHVGLVIEAKSRKKQKNALTKEEHGQLLVAAEWFAKNYPGQTYVRVSVHPRNRATKAAVAGASHALTYEKLAELVSDARALLTGLCESQLPEAELAAECSRQLASSRLRADRIIESYLAPFSDEV